MTRRQVQVVLGVLWLLDGALQFQPFMFGHGFAEQVIAPAGDGQPVFVSAVVDWGVRLIGAHPVAWDSLFGLTQVAIGIGLVVRATVRPALLVSFAWAAGVWYVGEGLGGLASGHADLLTGAPGAVLLYLLVGVAVWPHRSTAGTHDQERPAAWLPLAWAALWVGGAVFRVLPGQGGSAALAGEIRGNADGAPGWLAGLDRTAAAAVHDAGMTVIVLLVVVELAIGLGGLAPGAARRVAATAGIVVSVAFWVLGQSLGELYTGQATDPNAAPLVVLLALALVSASPSRLLAHRRHGYERARSPHWTSRQSTTPGRSSA